MLLIAVVLYVAIAFARSSKFDGFFITSPLLATIASHPLQGQHGRARLYGPAGRRHADPPRPRAGACGAHVVNLTPGS